MPSIRAALLLLLIPFFGNVRAQSIDTSSSSITFKVGNMKINSVDGRFSGLSGTVHFDASDPAASKFDVCVKSNTVHTGNKSRDKSLRGDGFFDVDKYPTICFTSSAVERTDKSFVAKGKLTMHGTTKDVDIPFTYANKTLTGAFTIDRRDYSVGSNGTFMVGDEVEVSIICVMK